MVARAHTSGILLCTEYLGLTHEDMILIEASFVFRWPCISFRDTQQRCANIHDIQSPPHNTSPSLLEADKPAKMNTRPVIESSTNPVALSASFNQDASCFAIGLDTGFCSMSPHYSVQYDTSLTQTASLQFRTMPASCVSRYALHYIPLILPRILRF